MHAKKPEISYTDSSIEQPSIGQLEQELHHTLSLEEHERKEDENSDSRGVGEGVVEESKSKVKEGAISENKEHGKSEQTLPPQGQTGQLGQEGQSGQKGQEGQIEAHHVIMCMIFTTPEQWIKKALAVRLTWAKR